MSDHLSGLARAWVGRSTMKFNGVLTKSARLTNCYLCEHFQYWVDYHHWWKPMLDLDKLPNIE